MSNALPRSRPRDELVVTELPDELLVYDTRRHQAHCLSPAAAVVWRLCDGATTEAQARAALAAAGLDGKAETVDQAVEQLAEAHLLEPKTVSEDILVRSRRRAIKQMALIGGTALALPLVKSIIAPTSAEACTSNNGQPGDSCGPSQCCEFGITCCNGTCCNTSCCNGTCCPTGTFCDYGGGTCCPTGKYPRGTACPPGTDTCCSGTCPPEGTCL